MNGQNTVRSEKMFSQRELEKHIAKRLVRERKQNAALSELRDAIDTLMSEGAINAGTYAEAARELTRALPRENVGNTCDAVTEISDRPTEKAGEALTDSTVPSKAAYEETEGPEETSEKPEPCLEDYAAAESTASDREANSDRAGELSALMERYPELDVAELLSNEDFVRYCRRYGGALPEMYEGYKRLIDSLGALSAPQKYEKEDNTIAQARRVLSSTSFSGSSASPSADAGFELTPLQRDIARRAGLSYREYSEMLRDVPGADRLKRNLK